MEFSDGFEPDADGLLRAISAHVSDAVLEAISRADNGDDAGEHFAALRQIRDRGTFPVPMAWCPAEVLELIRWSEPEQPEWKPGETGEFGHWMRAFSCAALLRATREPWNYGDGLATESTAVQMVASLLVLSVDFSRQAVSFMAWLLDRPSPSFWDEQAFAYAVALLGLALRCVRPFEDETLIGLAKQIMEKSDESCDGILEGNPCGVRDMVTGCQKQSAWEALAVQMLELDLSGRSPELRGAVEGVAERMMS